MRLGATSGANQQVFKVLFTAAVVAVAWFAFKGRRRVTDGTAYRFGRAFRAARRAMDESAKSRKTAEEPKSSVPIELKPCPRCGTYIAAGTACTCTKQ
jgi:hypothetical protein